MTKIATEHFNFVSLIYFLKYLYDFYTIHRGFFIPVDKHLKGHSKESKIIVYK